MKHIKSILALVLVVVLLTGCGAGLKLEDLTGKWTMTCQSDLTEATYLLDMIDLYAEERTHVDLNSLEYVLTVEFTADGGYAFNYDVEATKACVRSFYEGVMDALYENRTTLNSVYETTFDDLSREEFNQFYASLYGASSYELLLDSFAEYAYDYTALAEPLETGTFKIVGTSLMCTITGETEAQALGCELDGDTLKLIYSDAEEIYTRAN